MSPPPAPASAPSRPRASAADGGGPGSDERRPVSLGHRVEYLLVRALAFVLLSTDLRGAVRIAEALAGLLGALDRRHRRTAEDNLRRALGPDMAEGAAGPMARAVYRSLGRTAAEFVHGPRRLRGGAVRRFLSVSGHEPYAGGGPVIFLSAHHGNWEHAPAAARTAGFDVVSVSRPLDNPLLDRWVEGIRAATGAPTVSKRGALRGLLRVVRGGRSVGMLMDQNAGRHGRPIPFFGRIASTIPTGVALARRLGVPVAVATMERRAPGFHVLRFWPPLHVGDGEDAEDRALAEVNRRLERDIRRRPADWLWLHRRWRLKEEWGLGGSTEEAR